jgi:hypothetical protein
MICLAYIYYQKDDYPVFRSQIFFAESQTFFASLCYLQHYQNVRYHGWKLPNENTCGLFREINVFLTFRLTLLIMFHFQRRNSIFKEGILYCL